MGKTNRRTCICALVALFLAAGPLKAQEKFSKLVGEVKYGEVSKGEVVEVPFLTWGGDVATFHANGGLETRADSLFGKLGLKLKLTNGDDFPAQVRNYVSGKTPFVRGTFSMLGQASEVLNHNANTKPIVFLHMTWSAGDHMVARANCKTLNDLKGKKIVLQAGGPHVGMLDDVLRTAGLKWKDISVVWVKDVTGKDGPAETFRKDVTIDACFVISPEMQALTGGLEKLGTGAAETVKDAHVLVSTVNMKRSIADVLAVRKDFYDANRSVVEKLAAGYLKGCDDLLQLKAKASKDRDAQEKYKAVLKLTQDILGKETIRTEDDADGLISDAVFVGLPGNRAFFQEKGNLSGFVAKQKHALDLAVGEKYAEARTTFLPVAFDYKEIAKLVDLATDIAQPRISLPTKVVLGEPLFTFVITFEPNQKEFSEDKYGDDFKKAVEQASLFGNAVVTIRGHVDPTKVLGEFVQTGLVKGTLTRKGTTGNYTYYLKDGTMIDLDDPKSMKIVAEIIEKEDYKDAPADPQTTLKLCQKLSQDRADRVEEVAAEVRREPEIHPRQEPDQASWRQHLRPGCRQAQEQGGIGQESAGRVPPVQDQGRSARRGIDRAAALRLLTIVGNPVRPEEGHAYEIPRSRCHLALVVSVGWVTSSAVAHERFSKLVGEVKYGEVSKGEVLEVPFLTWGGDVATFHANGGLETRADSLFGKLGLKLKLTNGDDFPAQVRNMSRARRPSCVAPSACWGKPPRCSITTPTPSRSSSCT